LHCNHDRRVFHAAVFLGAGKALPARLGRRQHGLSRVCAGHDARFELKKAQDRAADQDEGAIFILIITVVAAAVSLAAIVALLGTLKDSAGAQRGVHFTLAALTIMISWILIHVMFALHYAHEFYGGEDVGRGGGLKFPGDPRPDYWDFVYFSFVIGMTFQVSDVQVTGKHLRRLVVAHGVVAFFFNVAILALAVNIGSQMI
jgi:uncharacterized membrane protein